MQSRTSETPAPGAQPDIQQEANPRRAFRHDLNALRAIAVVAVLLFHFRIPGFSGGFVGVDLFYVISGMLMTEIISNRLRQGRFTLRRFYADRIRRILPALCALILVGLGVGYFLLDPISYRTFGYEAAASSLFVSNVAFYLQSGYFDASSLQKWLLHTWSTSLEVQFYLVYPIALALLLGWLRLPMRWFKLLVWLGFLGSLAFSILCVNHDGGMLGFYLLPARLWEMLAGALTALYAPPAALAGLPSARRRVMHFAGLALVLLSIFLFDQFWAWPSWHALVPVAGASLILFAGSSDEFWCRLPPVGALGDWSYSIYIWHWPVVVALAYVQAPWSLAPMLCASLAVVLISAASYRFVEQPFRVGFKPNRPPHRTAYVLAAMWAAGLVGSIAVYHFHGLPGRAGRDPAVFADAAAAAADVAPNRPNCQFTAEGSPKCHVGPNTPGLVVLGDSHAELLFGRFATDDRLTRSVTLMGLGGCAPLPGGLKASPACRAFVDQAYRYILNSDEKQVLVAAYWINYADPEGPPGNWPDEMLDRRRSLAPGFRQAMPAFTEWLRALRSRGKDVVLVLPFPSLTVDVPAVFASDYFRSGRIPDDGIDRRAFEQRTATVRQLLVAAAAASGSRVVDPVAALCGPQRCPVTSPDGKLLYRDSNHIRFSIARGPAFDFIDQALRAR